MDYYLRTTSKEDFLQDLKEAGIHIQMEGDYYQDTEMCIDWIGLIPNSVEIDDQDAPLGEMTFKTGQHVNIRTVRSLDTSLFQRTTDVHPDPPYRMFS